MPKHIESLIQQSCKRWFDYQYNHFSKLLFAVPNGGLRGKHEAAIMKREGVTAGVADMILLVPRHGYASLCIEFKTYKGRQSPEQKAWQEAAQLHGNKYVVVRTFDQFVQAVTAYLG